MKAIPQTLSVLLPAELTDIQRRRRRQEQRWWSSNGAPPQDRKKNSNNTHAPGISYASLMRMVGV